MGLFGMDMAGGYGVAEVGQAVALAEQLDEPRLRSHGVVDQLLVLFVHVAGRRHRRSRGRLPRHGPSLRGGEWELMSALSLAAFAWGFPP